MTKPTPSTPSLTDHAQDPLALVPPVLPCRLCGRPVPDDSPPHVRLALCAMCAAFGCLAACTHCGASYPEHGPGGIGCATWLQAPDVPIPGVDDDLAAPWQYALNQRVQWGGGVSSDQPYLILRRRVTESVMRTWIEYLLIPARSPFRTGQWAYEPDVAPEAAPPHPKEAPPHGYY